MIFSKEPFVSIILSNYNGLKHLKECFDSLYKLNYSNFEIIFIDNNSKDKSVEFIKENYKSVKLLQNKKDFGFAKANNIAASYAKGKYLAFLNIDTAVDKNWLNELIPVAESSHKIGIIMSKHYYYHDKKLINLVGSTCDKFLRPYHIGLNKRDHKLFNIQREIFHACFAGALMRTDLYKKIGLFDPIYYAFAEDLDISWRTWLSGYQVLYTPKSIIYHKTGQILGKTSFKKRYLIERNKMRTLMKNYELKTLIMVLPVYLIKKILFALKLMLSFKKHSIYYILIRLKAIFWNILKIKSLIKERKFIRTIRKKDDKFIFDIMEKTLKFQKATRCI